MKNLDAIIEDLQPYPVRHSLIERKCQKYGLKPADDVTEEKAIATIVIEVLVQMMSLNNVSEGGVSISFDKDAVETYIISLCSQYGFDSSKFLSRPSATYIED